MSESATTAVPIVFGEALVDAFGDTLMPGGAPFNVACHLAALGLSPLMITRLGNDQAGRLLCDTAAGFGLSLQAAQREPVSARVHVHERDGSHVFEIPAGQAFDRIDASEALQAAAAVTGPNRLYFGTLALRQPVTRAALAALRTSQPLRAFVDLNWRQAGPPPEVILEVLQDIEVLKLSEAELEQLLSWLGLPPTTEIPVVGEQQAVMARLCRHVGARHILISHGAQGATGWDARGCCIARALPPPVPCLRDTVGAGDAFSALMLAGWLMDLPLAGTLAQAVAFASLSCSWRGALPTQATLYDPWRSYLGTAARSPPPTPPAR